MIELENRAEEKHIESLKKELQEMYSFTSEELKNVQNWGFIIRTVAEYVPLDQSIETYEYAWYLRGDRSDLPPYLQFEGFPSVEGTVPLQDLESLGNVAIVNSQQDTSSVYAVKLI